MTPKFSAMTLMHINIFYNMNATVTILPSSLFAHLTPNSKSIAVKFQCFSDEEKPFIVAEMKRLMKEGIIKLSKAP